MVALTWQPTSPLASGEATTADAPVTWWQGMGAAASEGLASAPGPTLLREAGRGYEERTNPSPVLSADELNARFGASGLKFDGPMQEGTAREMAQLHAEQQQRAAMQERAGIGFVPRFAAGLVGAAADPVSLAAGVLPGAALARAGFAARSTLAGRMAVSAAEGAAGTALAVPITAAIAPGEGRQYGAADALMDIAFGGVFGALTPLAGAGLHAGIERYARMRTTGEPMPVLSQAMEAAPIEVRDMALRTAVSQVMEGRPVDIGPVVARALSYSTDLLRPASREVNDIAARAADVVARSTQVRPSGQPVIERNAMKVGAVGGRGPDGRPIEITWGRVGDVGVAVLPDDLQKIGPVSSTMTPVRSTETRTEWAVTREPDNRVLSITRTATPDGGERWNVRVLPKGERPERLSQFIGRDVPTVSSGDAVPTAAGVSVMTASAADVSDPAFIGAWARAQATRWSDPADAAASVAADARVDAVPEPRARAPEQAIGTATADVSELDALLAQDSAVLDDMRARGVIDAADEAEIRTADEDIARTDTVADARGKAALCMAGAA
ncbi:hypothetical protein QFZ27_004667 [Inquilinus ginsengisoli]|uniref:hypothetical protein n=1 Tax=Inquilinus ginsengisoli TaxID=363840 RepID=UPI003D25120E